MKKAKTPKAPDYASLANQQAATAKQNWQENVAMARPDQTGPEGSLDWSKDPTSGEWSQSVSLAPERQEIWDTLQGKTQEQLAGYDTNQVDLSGAPAMPEVGGYDQRSIDTIRALQAPDIQRREAADRQRRSAMGLSGGERITETSERNLADASSRADMQAILAGIQQGNTAFGQGMQRHQTGTGDIINQQTANNQKLGGLMGQGNNFRLPQFAGVATPGMTNAVNPDLMGAAGQSYDAAVAEANAKNASDPWNQIVGIGTQLAGAYLGAPGVKADVPQTQTRGGMMMSNAGNAIKDWWNKPGGGSDGGGFTYYGQ